MTEVAWTAGQVIGGRYRLDELLGSGGQGAVWRVDHLTLRCPVALKVLDPSIAHHAEAVSRFLREAQAAATLRSPHVVQILDHGVHEGIPYIAMELLEGESLAVRLAREGRLSREATLRIISHVCRAVSKAHDVGIVHRDLKPGNIFLVKNEDEEMAKVLDFGIAKVMNAVEMSASTSTRTGAILGTPYYMSPEQARGKVIDFRSDLWSIAVIAFECLCGRVPFEGDSVGDLVLSICAQPLPEPSAVAPVPVGFDAWWTKAVSREPAGRFQSARELLEALRALIQPNIPEAASSRPSLVDASERISLHQMPTLAASAPGIIHSTTAAPVASASTGAPGETTVAKSRPQSSSRARVFGAIGAVVAVLGAVTLFISRASAPEGGAAVSAAVPEQSVGHTADNTGSTTPHETAPPIPAPPSAHVPEVTAASAAPSTSASSTPSRSSPRHTATPPPLATQAPQAPKPEPKSPPKEDLAL